MRIRQTLGRWYWSHGGGKKTYTSENKAHVEVPLRIFRLVRNSRADGVFEHGGFEGMACVIMRRRLVFELADKFGENDAQFGVRHSASPILGGMCHF